MNFSKSTRLPLWGLIALGFTLLLGSCQSEDLAGESPDIKPAAKECYVLEDIVKVQQAFDLITRAYRAEFAVYMHEVHDEVTRMTPLTRNDSLFLMNQTKEAVYFILTQYRRDYISPRFVTKKGTKLRDLMERVIPDDRTMFACSDSLLTFGRLEELPPQATLLDKALINMRAEVLHPEWSKDSRARYAPTALSNALMSQLYRIKQILEAEEGY